MRYRRRRDTTSDAPIGLNGKAGKILPGSSRAKTMPQRLEPLAIRSVGQMSVQLALPRNGEPRTDLSMGEHCDRWPPSGDIAREDQDALAVASHQNLARAYEEGFFNDLMTRSRARPSRDNNLRADSDHRKSCAA